MEQKQRYKMCLINDCLSSGGAEKVQALLSMYLVSKGIEVHHVIVTDSVEYEYAGSLLNLGELKDSTNGIINKLQRLKTLKRFLDHQNFDYIIDSRVKNKSLQEWVTARLLYRSPTIFVVHSAEPSYYFPDKKWLARSIHKKSFAIVTVTNGMKEFLRKSFQFQNLYSIHNPVDLAAVAREMPTVAMPTDFILAVGRMNDNIKQFDQLIMSYAASNLPQKNIDLVILGDGPLRATLEALTLQLNIQHHVVFAGHQANPYQFMKQCRFLVLASRSEGFANVLTETLACSKPVVSFDCDFGPREIITDRENGLLVANQDFTQLTAAMNLFVQDDSLYNHCRSNAEQSAGRFSLEIIGKQWLELMKINVS
jgi:N-acetylgalactosamine-N,N'-diacetylbacillosaminyl-diphospho-undecaprenol 4-alpha-N-acetylgalactosaminyltransferase